MDKINSIKLERIGYEVGADPEEAEEAEEEGWWEVRERMTTKGHCTVRGDNDYNNYAPPHLEYEAEVASSN